MTEGGAGQRDTVATASVEGGGSGGGWGGWIGGVDLPRWGPDLDLRLFSAWLLALWALGTAVGIAVLLARHLRFLRALHPRRPPRDPALFALLRATAAEVGLRRPPTLTESKGLCSPVLLPGGEICVPAGRFTRLDRRCQRSLLAHEMAHLARGDTRSRIALSVVSNLLFFQPLLRVASRELRDVAETLADARALRSTGEPDALAAALAQVAVWIQGGDGRAWAGIAAVEADSDLVRRVRQILGSAPTDARGFGAGPGIVLVAGVVGAVALGVPDIRARGGEVPSGSVPVSEAIADGPPVEGTRSGERPASVAGGRPREAPPISCTSERPPNSTTPTEGCDTMRYRALDDARPEGSEAPRGLRHDARSAGASVSNLGAVMSCVLAVGPLVGCGEGDGGAGAAPEPIRRDSAGIEIVENEAPRLEPGAWRIADAPSMSCSSDSRAGDQRILLVTDLLPLGPDRVGILSYENRMLLVCEGGAVTTAVGSEGEGPGEFDGGVYGAVRAPGDSLAVLGSRKVVVFAGDGSGFRELRLTQSADGRLSRFAERPGGLVGNRFAGGDVRIEGEGEVDLALLAWDGSEEGRIEGVPWSTSLGSTTTNALWDGDLQFEAARQGYWYASRDTSQVDYYGVAGDRRIVRTPFEPVPVTEQHRRLAVERITDLYAVEQELGQRFVTNDVERGVDRAPAVLDLLVDDQDRLWMRIPEPLPDEARSRWRVIDADGAWITDVAVPEGFRLMAVEGDFAYGVSTDALGLETVEVRALEEA